MYETCSLKLRRLRGRFPFRKRQQHGALSMEERETKTATSRISGLTDPFVLKSSDAR
jgi:hypothetical protein